MISAALLLSACVTKLDGHGIPPPDCANMPDNLRGVSAGELHEAWGPPDSTAGSGLITDIYLLRSGEAAYVTTTAKPLRLHCEMPPEG